MSESERLTATPAGVALCRFEAIPDGTARNFVLQMRGGRFHGFVVRKGAAAFGYLDRCPHQGLPLARELDAYLTPSATHIACSWHGALFDIDTGRCVGGPCTGQRLTPWPVAVIDDVLVTAHPPEATAAPR